MIKTISNNFKENTMRKYKNKKNKPTLSSLSNLKLIYEAKGNFSLFFMDIIAGNFVKGVDLISAVKKNVLIFFMNEEVLEENFLKKTISFFLNKKDFDFFFKKLFSAKEKIETSFNNMRGKTGNFKLFLVFLDSVEDFIKKYNLIDISLSKKNEEELKKKNIIVYKNYLKIGNQRNKLREFINNFILSKDSNFERAIKNVADIFDINKRDILFYNKTEIKNLCSGIKLSKKDIKKRKESFVIVNYNNETYYYFGKEIFNQIKKLKQYQQFSSNNVTSVKGNIAFSNNKIIKGKIYMFPDVNFNKINFQVRNMLKKLSKNDKVIFVTKITTPEMIPLFKKAGAIITDLGGLNSHAAITAREFKIPCIIGTKIATQVLKDGDMVEVDIKKGIIKKNK